MLRNKLILSTILFLFVFSCSNDSVYEGYIINLDSSLSNGLKSVSSITLNNNNSLQETFYVLPEKKLEDINIEFTYSHIKSHMEEGKKVNIKYEEINKIFFIVDFKFSDHSH